jgi:alkaline phosphatase D
VYANLKDRHEAAVTALPNNVLEVSVSPLNQFYIPIRTYHTTETDQELAYFPDGNQKYAVYTVDTTDPATPKLEVEIKIAGKTVWSHTFAGKLVVARGVETGRGVIEKGMGWLKQILISSRF